MARPGRVLDFRLPGALVRVPPLASQAIVVGECMLRRIWILVCAIGMATSVGCGGDDDSGAKAELSVVEQLEAVGIGKYLSRDIPTPTSDGDWLHYEFEPSEDGPICLFGTPYQVFVRPGQSDKVLFYLEGGGGCWNEETCFGDTALGAKETSDPIAPLTVFGGILGTGPGNPLGGWSVVYVPYCDGSVFGGDNVVEYDRGTVYHRGQANISAGLDIMRDNFPNPSEIMVSGSSAGGYGTFTGYGVMRVAYPDKKIYVLNDSGPGLQNNDDQKSIDERAENWDFEQFIVDGCERCGEQLTFLIDWALANDPDTRMALFSYKRDFVISDFLMLERTDYRDLMLDVTDVVHALHADRFKRFMVEGESHTILLGVGVAPGFEVGVEGTFASLAIDGIGLSDWVADFVSDGPAWQDLIEGGRFLDFGEDPVNRPTLASELPRGSRESPTGLPRRGSPVRLRSTSTASWLARTTYPGGLEFNRETPMFLGSDPSGAYGDANSQLRGFNVLDPTKS